jgi:hypothetical protein
MDSVELRPFTVILLFPGYLDSDHPPETYMAHEYATNHVKAVIKAQERAVKDNEFPPGSAEEFYPLYVFDGHLKSYHFQDV